MANDRAHGRQGVRTLGSLREMEIGRSISCMCLSDSTSIMKKLNFLSTKLARLSGLALEALCFAGIGLPGFEQEAAVVLSV